jgi:capsular exopolysaccharide synthesis family protein
MRGEAPYLIEGPEPEPIHPFVRWKRFASFIRVYCWIPLLLAAAASGAAYMYLSRQPQSYASNARMWVGGKMHISEGNFYSEEVMNFYGTQMELMESPLIAQRARARLQSLRPDDAPQRVRVKASQIPKASIFALTASGTDPEYTQTYLNTLMDEYLSYKREVRSALSGDTMTSVTNQLYEQERELRVAQESLHAFQSSNNVVALQELGATAARQLGTLNVTLADLKLEYELLTKLSPDVAVQALPKTEPQGGSADRKRIGVPPVAASGPSGEYLKAKEQVEMLRLEREERGRYWRPAHPKMQKLEEDIARSEKQLEFYRQQSGEQLAEAKHQLKLRMQALEDAIVDWEGRLQISNQRLADLKKYEVNVARAQGVFDRLQSLQQNLRMGSNLEQETVAVLERATPAMPAKKTLPLMMAAAGVAGMVLGLALILLIERLDDRFASLNELRNQVSEDIVGQVPRLPSPGRKGKLELIQDGDARHMFVESYRNIRSSLLFMDFNGARPKRILITSAVPNEGKSTVAANLARTLALGGARVLLVDGDLRRGGLHRLLDLPQKPGLSELLSRETTLDKVLTPTPMKNLSFVPSGRLTSSSGELFLSPVMDRFLKQVETEFDHVIVDGVPVFAADDSTSLGPKMDGVVFVVRGSFTRARMARHALELLRQRQVKILGVVFNQADASARDYGYYKYREYYGTAEAANG